MPRKHSKMGVSCSKKIYPLSQTVINSMDTSSLIKLLQTGLAYAPITIEPPHVISNNVAFDKCRLRPACAASCYA